jgi:predicted ABC-type ATPase
MPNLHIITGSNGAGKSSVGPSYLPETIQTNCTVFDGDKLFMEKKNALWAAGSRAIKENKKIANKEVTDEFDRLVSNALKEGIDFAYEGHFTNDATWDVPKRFKEQGFLDSHDIFRITRYRPIRIKGCEPS